MRDDHEPPGPPHRPFPFTGETIPWRFSGERQQFEWDTPVPLSACNRPLPNGWPCQFPRGYCPEHAPHGAFLRAHPILQLLDKIARGIGLTIPEWEELSETLGYELADELSTWFPFHPYNIRDFMRPETYDLPYPASRNPYSDLDTNEVHFG